jgi:O-antigen/teichoic acid export membrane protein
LAIIHGEGSKERLNALFRESEFVWLRLGIGLTVIACAVMQPLTDAWLGEEAGRAWLYGVLLTAAYGLNVLAGPALSYLRAIGKPGLEARYGAITIIANVVLTILLGIAFGPVGVVSATLVAYASGTGWLFARLRAVLPARTQRARPGLSRALIAAAAAGALALGWSLLANEWLPRPVALGGIGIGAGAALSGYLVVALGMSPGKLRAVLVGERVPAG